MMRQGDERRGRERGTMTELEGVPTFQALMRMNWLRRLERGQ